MYGVTAPSLLSKQMEKDKEEADLTPTTAIIAFLILLPITILINLIKGFVDLIFQFNK